MGKLYGVGVGPGAPDLLTLRALKVIREADHLFVASSSRNQYSLALEVVAPHLPPGREVRRLAFPMTYREEELRAAWRENARLVARALEDGDVAFLTLGDPCLYSTFSYLVRELASFVPALECEVVPGITAAQAAAARLGVSLAEGDEAVLLLPGTRPSRLARLVREVDTLVLYKVYRQAEEVVRVLAEAGRLPEVRAISHCGMPREQVHPDPSRPESFPYFTLFIVGGKPLK